MMSTYSTEYIETKFGKVEFLPVMDLVAGSFFQAEFKITIGVFGIDDGGHIKIAWPVSNSFGIPQLDNPQGQGYIKVTCNSDARFKTEFDHNGYMRPFFPAITLKVFDGYLAPGDKISIFIGYTGEGGKGWESQTYVENGIEFLVLLDPFGTNVYENLPSSPKINILAGKAAKLFAVAKPEVVIGEMLWTLLRVDDRYGNAVVNFEGKLQVSGDDGAFSQEVEFTKEDKGSVRINSITFSTAGKKFVKVTDPKTGIETLSNPILVSDIKQDLTLYWGDLHGQTGETVGSGTIEEYLEFGKKYAALDFISHAANDFQITIPIWENTQRRIKEFHQPDQYITFLGYEWSGSPPAGGDHNVYFLNDDQQIHRSSHALIPDKSDLDTDRYPVSELYNQFKGQSDVMIIPHIGGRRASLDVFDESLTPFIEIASVHGHFEWFAEEALDMGLITGFIASSDTHSGRPGNGFAVSKLEAVKSGLTGVYANELTRESLWDAFKKRHVYGTSGPRIILRFIINGAIMGDHITAEDGLDISVEVHGTENIETIDVYRNKEIIHSYQPLHEKGEVNWIKIQWRGARVKARRRNLSWDGSVLIEDATIISVQPFGFDLPWEGIFEQNETSVKFTSSTAGDYDGIILKLKNVNTNSILKFNSLQGNTEVRIQTLTNTFVKKLGEVEKVIEIKPYTDKLKKSVKFSFSRIDDLPGHYWVRIIQVDGEKAWSSPIFVSN